MSLFAWYNLPFTVALGLSVLLMLLQILGFAGEQDSEVDVDGELAVDGEIAAETEIEVAGPEGVSADADSAFSLLSALGVGRVPLSIVLFSFLGCFGLAGLLGSALTMGLLEGGIEVLFLANLALALLMGGFLTRYVSRGVMALAPSTSTAVRAEDLAGRVGIVVTPTVSETYGRVEVRDQHGALHTVFAIAEAGPIPNRSEVALVAYDPVKRHYVVRRMGNRSS